MKLFFNSLVGGIVIGGMVSFLVHVVFRYYGVSSPFVILATIVFIFGVGFGIYEYIYGRSRLDKNGHVSDKYQWQIDELRRRIDELRNEIADVLLKIKSGNLGTEELDKIIALKKTRND